LVAAIDDAGIPFHDVTITVTHCGRICLPRSAALQLEIQAYRH
jgi:hypothetical protein